VSRARVVRFVWNAVVVAGVLLAMVAGFARVATSAPLVVVACAAAGAWSAACLDVLEQRVYRVADPLRLVMLAASVGALVYGGPIACLAVLGVLEPRASTPLAIAALGCISHAVRAYLHARRRAEAGDDDDDSDDSDDSDAHAPGA
jgi:hypothetical protein